MYSMLTSFFGEFIMLKIAICDDDYLIREYLADVVSRELHTQAELYENGEALLEADTEYDIFLIDICLEKAADSGKINGMETARQLRQKSNGVIIFITALREYVYDAYDVEAFHYLLKPIDEKKLCEVLKKAAAKVEEKMASLPLLIKTNGAYRQIPIEDIYYAENDARKIVLHTKEGEISYYEKMEVLEQKLGAGFFRSHRGYLVHLQEVAGYDRSSITLKCGDTVFLAKQKYNDFVTAYMNYLMR